MSIQQDTSTKYCSTSEVARYFRGNQMLDSRDFPTQANASDGEPTQDDVEAYIEKWSARMDRRTGQSWRENQVVEETHDHDMLYYWLSGHPVNLIKRNIKTPLDSTKGDKLEIYTGNKWQDWVSDSSYTEGRENDYWVDEAVGILYVYERAILRPHPKFRITYRYGEDTVPADIRDAVAGRVAADLIHSDVYGTVVPGNNNSSNSDPQQSAEEWKEQFDRVAEDYRKVHFV